MKTLLRVAAVATAVFLPVAAAQAQSQGSNQAGDYALSWGAVRDGYGSPSGAFDGAYGRYGDGRRHYRRQWR